MSLVRNAIFQFIPISMLALVSFFYAGAAFADPPARVGRLSYVDGAVSTHTAGQDQWTAAALNTPVTTGDAFWTEPNARGEIQVGAMEIRMDHGTELDVTTLDDRSTRLEVPQGVVNLHLRAMPQGGVLIDTPQGEVSLTQPGSYHIDTGHPNGDQPAAQGQIAVLEGGAEINGPRAKIDIMPGEAAVIAGNPSSFQLVEASPTPFDDWALTRERRERVSHTQQYIPTEMTGYEDLDDYGRWDTDPSYGSVWYPSDVGADWAPYSVGSWAFYDPWGWTWVDDEPWGFAPFHYGRWFHRDGRWGWSSGRFEGRNRPVFSPALVAFTGGNRWNVRGRPAVGWVPLAPNEPFRPSFRASNRFIQNINQGNIQSRRNPSRFFSASQLANHDAMTAVPADAFARGEQVRAARLSVAATERAGAPVTANISSIRPSAPATAAIGARNEGRHPAPGPRNAASWERITASPAATGRAAPETAAPRTATPAMPALRAETSRTGAPGPAIRHRPAERQASREAVRPAERASAIRPAAGQPQAQSERRAAGRTERTAIAHPVQRTHFKATPKGWSRVPSGARGSAAPRSRAQAHAKNDESGKNQGGENKR